jgi:hypothetical protein
MRSTRPGSALAKAALVLFAILLAGSLFWSTGRAARRVYQGWLYAGESGFDERSRLFNPAYAQAIEELRKAIPEDGIYALVDADPHEMGSVIWVRYYLAPRKAILLGFLDDLRTPRDVRQRLIREARWVIVASFDEPPILYQRHEFMKKLETLR